MDGPGRRVDEENEVYETAIKVAGLITIKKTIFNFIDEFYSELYTYFNITLPVTESNK